MSILFAVVAVRQRGIFFGVVNGLNLVVFAAVICRTIASWRREAGPVSARAGFEPLPPALRDDLVGTMSDVIGCLGLPKEAIQFWITNYPSADPAPGMSDRKGIIAIILPIAFFKLFHNDRPMARAMLAHELGHVGHADTRLWKLAQAFWGNVARFFLPWQILILLVMLLGLVPNLIDAQEQLAAARENAHDNFAAADDQYQAALGQEADERSVGGDVNEDTRLNAAGAQINRMSAELNVIVADSRTNPFYAKMIFIAFAGVVPCVWVFLFVRAVANTIKKSEAAADLAAVVTGCGPALEAALTQYGLAPRSRRWLSLYPSTSWRIRRIRRAVAELDR